MSIEKRSVCWIKGTVKFQLDNTQSIRFIEQVFFPLENAVSSGPLAKSYFHSKQYFAIVPCVWVFDSIACILFPLIGNVCHDDEK